MYYWKKTKNKGNHCLLECFVLVSSLRDCPCTDSHVDVPGTAQLHSACAELGEKAERLSAGSVPFLMLGSSDSHH